MQTLHQSSDKICLVSAPVFHYSFVLSPFSQFIRGLSSDGCQRNLMGLAPLRRSAEALPIVCDASNARTMAVGKYHCTDIWIIAAELLNLLWNADISRSVCPSFRRRVSAQWLPIYRKYLICPILRRRYLASLSLSKSKQGQVNKRRKGGRCLWLSQTLNERTARISRERKRSRMSSSMPQ